MSECADKRFERMLYAWELGLLPEDQQSELELHLYECDSCFEKAAGLLDTTRLIRHSGSVRVEAARLSHERDGRDQTAPRPEVSRAPWKRYIPVTVAAAAILILLVLRPWQLEIRSTQEAIAAENRLAIVYFRNVADTTDALKTAQIATDLLITDLSESNYLDVVSGQRLYDILKLLGKEGTKDVDPDAAARVAETAKARWLLTGNILQTEPHLVVTAQLSDAESGQIVAAEHITGEPGEDIFSIIDRLTVGIKSDLALPDAAKSESDPLVAEVTTHSPKAYRYYLDGLDAYYKFYMDVARQSFTKAIRADSNFAMAYYYLIRLVGPVQRNEMLAHLMKLSGNVGDRQRRYIDVLAASAAGNVDRAVSLLRELVARYPDEKEAYYQLGSIAYSRGEYQECIDELLKATEIDPLYKRPYNLLAYSYDRLGDFDHAIQAIDQYANLAPEEANPYDSRADIYARNGRLDGAIESYQKALEIRPDYLSSLGYLGIMYVFAREFDRADSCFAEFERRADPSVGASSILYRAYIPVHQGKCKQVLVYLDSTISLIQSDTSSSDNMRLLTYLLVEKATVLEVLGDLDQAVACLSEYMAVSEKLTPGQVALYEPYYVHLLVKNGEMARAEQQVEHLKDRSSQSGADIGPYFQALAAFDIGNGNLDEAMEHLKKAADESPDFAIHYRLSLAFLEAGKKGQAVSELKKLAATYTSPRAFLGVWSISLHYYLGLAYEQSGWNSDAIREYSTFADAWKDADTTISMLNDATKRLTELKKGS